MQNKQVHLLSLQSRKLRPRYVILISKWVLMPSLLLSLFIKLFVLSVCNLMFKDILIAIFKILVLFHDKTPTSSFLTALIHSSYILNSTDSQCASLIIQNSNTHNSLWLLRSKWTHQSIYVKWNPVSHSKYSSVTTVFPYNLPPLNHKGSLSLWTSFGNTCIHF